MHPTSQDASNARNVRAPHTLVLLVLVGVAIDLLVLRVERRHQAVEQLVVALVNGTRRYLHLKRALRRLDRLLDLRDCVGEQLDSARLVER